MYDKILVAIDHSEASDRALLAARDLALLSKGEVWVLHLLEREIASRTAVVLATRRRLRPAPRSRPRSTS